MIFRIIRALNDFFVQPMHSWLHFSQIPNIEELEEVEEDEDENRNAWPKLFGTHDNYETDKNNGNAGITEAATYDDEAEDEAEDKAEDKAEDEAEDVSGKLADGEEAADTNEWVFECIA